jgi:hypothetical protein
VLPIDDDDIEGEAIDLGDEYEEDDEDDTITHNLN